MAGSRFSTFHQSLSTEVPLFAAGGEIECRAVPSRALCTELDELRRGAVSVFREVRAIRRSRDLSFDEDAELNWRKRASIYSILRHLLVGHGGRPCPGGSRPIVSAVPGDAAGDQGAIASFIAAVRLCWLDLGQRVGAVGLLGTAAIQEVGDEGQDGEVEGHVDAQGHAEKAAERRGQRLVLCRSKEFRDFQAG